MENNYAREFDWNDEIAQDSEFLLLPEGDYYFTVESFEGQDIHLQLVVNCHLATRQ